MDTYRSRKMSAIWTRQLRNVWVYNWLRPHNHPGAYPDIPRLESSTGAESGYYCAFLAGTFYYSLLNSTIDSDPSDCIWRREFNIACALGND